MNDLIGRVLSFEKAVFPDQSALYAKLAQHGQSPKALMISCADSRVVPEHIMQAAPGDLFVCRNAGNIVPPSSSQMGGVSSTVEYAVSALGVRDIIICGHSDCGAMKALMNPEMLNGMPNVAAWLRHSHAAECVVRQGYPELTTRKASAPQPSRTSSFSCSICARTLRSPPASHAARSRCTAGSSISARARCTRSTGRPAASPRSRRTSRFPSRTPRSATARRTSNIWKPQSETPHAERDGA